ncbi:transcriptional regulator GlxA family with amidase domain [Crossiella equi]|uniref:Transcriptional regulator GlxA family with amidase domain n=1 Tax=Crossiella equi TaxID=130796 RepID=A0ABS5A3P5_9PSEU|nr:GlxA family transcriptional regulator [Crossiella equi]MBP2471195.1 transcriptional regulator GlxA family with amidase domain [Crossiella equi]
MHQVLIPVFDGVQPLDVTGPYEALAHASTLVGPERGYTLRLVAAEDGPVRAESGMALLPDGPLPASGAVGTLLVPGGRGARTADPHGALLRWLRRAVHRAERVTSVCSGAFLLAATGVLDGVPVATHWRQAEDLAARYPAVRVRPDPIYVRHGRVWTSAGISAGIDLALALIEADHGVDLAQEVARELVVFLRRPGGQSQFAGPVWDRPARTPSIRAAQDLIHGRPGADLRVPVLAAHVGLSERHFSREFQRALGCPPGDYVEKVRVDLARTRLETGEEPVPVIAEATGFGTAETMRRAFLRRLGVPPAQYRRHFTTATQE